MLSLLTIEQQSTFPSYCLVYGFSDYTIMEIIMLVSCLLAGVLVIINSNIIGCETGSCQLQSLARN